MWVRKKGYFRFMSDLVRIFEKYKNNPIALYGLGTETERVLEEFGETFHIVGLLDSFRENGCIYGKRIISLSDCSKYGVKLIIVVARPGSCRAIYKRIGNFCMQSQIMLLDVHGRDLCMQKRIIFDFKGTDGITKEQIARLTSDVSVVSFDLFDTLIMRQTFLVTDIFELVEAVLKKKGIFIDNFCNKRQQAEKELSRCMAPTLERIYQFVLDHSEAVDVTSQELAQFEYEIDYNVIVPRRDMVKFYCELLSQGKQVYIVTDTYYTKKQLRKLLEKCGISCYTDILASCEYKTGKAQNLFSVLTKAVGGQKSIHIGDDHNVDVESAERNDIKACRIYSGADLLEMTGHMGLWEYADSLASRIKIGMFIAKVFNSPFQFEMCDRRLHVNDAYSIGYLFMAPVITDFTIWFTHKAEEMGLKTIWFGARDGYLIKKLYDILQGNNTSVYFLTSRTAVIRAGIESEQDIKYVAEMKFSGTLEQQLKERFGIDVEDADEEKGTLTDYSKIIMENSLIKRKNYQKYIDHLPEAKGDIAFFDFVAKGTNQLFISRFVDNHLKGLYFLQLEKEHMADKGLDITPFFEWDEKQGGAIYEDYYILETVMTSKDASVLEFDENGQPVYGKETRESRDIKCFDEMQKGIIDYFKTYVCICPEFERVIDKDLDQKFLSLLHKFKILDEDFMRLVIEDTFFNRMTGMTDLI